MGAKKSRDVIYKNYDFLYQKYIIDNLSIKEVAKIATCSPSSIQYYLRKLNINKPVHSKFLSNKTSVETIIQLYKSGLSCEQIAKQIGLNRNLVSKRLKQFTQYPKLASYKKDIQLQQNQVSKAYFGKVRRRAKLNKLEFSITIEYLQQLYHNQQCCCALSGVVLKMPVRCVNKEIDTKYFNLASLDRIDSSKGYIVDNVQWVDAKINKMKLDLTDNEFIKLCKRVVEHENFVRRSLPE